MLFPQGGTGGHVIMLTLSAALCVYVCWCPSVGCVPPHARTWTLAQKGQKRTLHVLVHKRVLEICSLSVSWTLKKASSAHCTFWCTNVEICPLSVCFHTCT